MVFYDRYGVMLYSYTQYVFRAVLQNKWCYTIMSVFFR